MSSRKQNYTTGLNSITPTGFSQGRGTFMRVKIARARLRKFNKSGINTKISTWEDMKEYILSKTLKPWKNMKK